LSIQRGFDAAEAVGGRVHENEAAPKRQTTENRMRGSDLGGNVHADI